eukprot:scaffold10968_cov170-Ochromonas_danica.AAC.2
MRCSCSAYATPAARSSRTVARWQQQSGSQWRRPLTFVAQRCAFFDCHGLTCFLGHRADQLPCKLIDVAGRRLFHLTRRGNGLDWEGGYWLDKNVSIAARTEASNAVLSADATKRWSSSPKTASVAENRRAPCVKPRACQPSCSPVIDRNSSRVIASDESSTSSQKYLRDLSSVSMSLRTISTRRCVEFSKLNNVENMLKRQ